ncbi:MAG: hypothetical protein JST92_13695, partial [Deltaproteobacteria bacterium]|nr:hypothetical protein [Deltaproteobacteria bacterium]
MSQPRPTLCLLALACALSAAACKKSSTQPAPVPPVLAPGASLNFEAGPVRPLALSSDGKRLFVANTPDGFLEIVDVSGAAPKRLAAVSVGVEPVAVAVRNDSEVWVVNQVSDSVSVVDVASVPARVVRTLLVGDEPSDIVFAGPNRARAFITTAHRGQRRTSPALANVPGAGDPKLTTSGIGRADVWVFDAADPGPGGGVPLSIVTLRGDAPRGLAVTPDGNTVYASIFKSGNGTTVTSSLLPCNGFDVDTPCTVQGTRVPGSALGPATNHAGVAAPRVGVMVKANDAGAFIDGRGRDWSGAIKCTLPDEDVFALDAATLT